jgi:hypothetical protein
VYWNVGVRPAASFVQAITRLAIEAISKTNGPFDPVMKVQLMKPPPPEEAGEIHESFVMSLGQQLAAAVAEQLQEYRERKDYAGLWGSMESYGTWPDYADLLVVENLYSPMQPIDLEYYVGIPLPSYWTGSRWLISTVSQQVSTSARVWSL